MRWMLFVFALILPSLAEANGKLEVRSCSASLFRMEGMTLDQKALVLSAGHCINAGSFHNDLGTFPTNGEVFLDRPENASLQIRSESGIFDRYHYRRLVFATMTDVDVAIYELDATYDDILRRRPDSQIFVMGTKPPALASTLRVTSANKDKEFSCVTEAIVPTLVDKPWRWTEVIRFKFQPSCLFFGGVSGSPVLDGDRIVGVANEVYDPGVACEFGTPCEIAGDGKISVAVEGQSYAVQTYRLYDCFDAAKKTFDFALPSCSLAGAPQQNARIELAPAKKL